MIEKLGNVANEGFRLEGFGQESIGIQLHGQSHQGPLGVSRQQGERQTPRHGRVTRSQRFEELKTVDVGHIEIRNDAVGCIATQLEQLDDFGPRTRRIRIREPVATQNCRGRIPNDFDIVHDEDEFIGKRGVGHHRSLALFMVERTASRAL